MLLYNIYIYNLKGMVPDVNQLMVKGKGVFVNVASKNTKSKLRGIIIYIYIYN